MLPLNTHAGDGVRECAQRHVEQRCGHADRDDGMKGVQRGMPVVAGVRREHERDGPRRIDEQLGLDCRVSLVSKRGRTVALRRGATSPGPASPIEPRRKLAHDHSLRGRCECVLAAGVGVADCCEQDERLNRGQRAIADRASQQIGPSRAQVGRLILQHVRRPRLVGAADDQGGAHKQAGESCESARDSVLATDLDRQCPPRCR